MSSNARRQITARGLDQELPALAERVGVIVPLTVTLRTLLAALMSVARALVRAGLQRPPIFRVSPPAARRLLSTTPRRLAQPPTPAANPVDAKDANTFLPTPPLQSVVGASRLTAADEPGKDVDPYKDGASALDKAVHLFFFTEILRGELL